MGAFDDFKEGLGVAGDIAGLAGSIGGLFGGKKGGGVGADFYWRQLELQEQLAKNGIQWRVDDAKRAGIHPLYALGNPGLGISPVMAGDSFSGGDTFGRLAAAGSDISRAVRQSMTKEDRDGDALLALQIERGNLENELLRSRLAREQQGQLAPAVPAGSAYLSDSGGSAVTVTPASSYIEEKPMERSVSHPTQPYQEPGAISDTGFVRTPTGLAPVPSKDAKERIEDQIIPEAMWGLRNHVLPSLGFGAPPPKEALPAGAKQWVYNVWRQEWQPDNAVTNNTKGWFDGMFDVKVRRVPDRKGPPLPQNKPWTPQRHIMIRGRR